MIQSFGFDAEEGNDSLDGGNWHDKLYGRHRNDTLVGGVGNDEFHFRAGYDDDIIVDFEGDPDTLVFNNLNLNNASDAMSHATQQGNDVVFDFGSNDTLLMQNMTLALMANDILII